MAGTANARIRTQVGVTPGFRERRNKTNKIMKLLLLSAFTLVLIVASGCVVYHRHHEDVVAPVVAVPAPVVVVH
jgi:hypothetical protein